MSVYRIYGWIAFFLLPVFIEEVVYASSTPVAGAYSKSTEIGWFWGQWEKENELDEALTEEIIPPPEEMVKKEQDCSNPLDWTVECGFVHPQRDYDFSQLQYAELTKQLAMNAEDPEKVLQYQKFVHWAVDQAITAARTAEWNIIQNQGMNPFIQNPIGSFGMRAAASALTDYNRSVIEDIVDQGGFLVFFTRHDCVYCHKMYPTNWLIANELNLDLYNAPLDGVCLEEFDLAFCYAGEDVIFAAKYLDVQVVPDLFLHLPKDNAWIRISSGVEDQQTIKRRMVTFFGAVKNAAQEGLRNAANANRPAVNFQTKDVFEKAREGLGAGVDFSSKESKNAEK